MKDCQMKTIKINESQFYKIFEASDAKAPDFNGGDVHEFNGSEVATTANVTNIDGDETYGKQPTTDKLADDLTTQNFWASQMKGSRMP